MYDNETKEAESRDDYGFLKGGETGDGALYESDDDIANPLGKDSIPNEPDTRSIQGSGSSAFRSRPTVVHPTKGYFPSFIS